VERPTPDQEERRQAAFRLGCWLGPTRRYSSSTENATMTGVREARVAAIRRRLTDRRWPVWAVGSLAHSRRQFSRAHSTRTVVPEKEQKLPRHQSRALGSSVGRLCNACVVSEASRGALHLGALGRGFCHFSRSGSLRSRYRRKPPQGHHAFLPSSKPILRPQAVPGLLGQKQTRGLRRWLSCPMGLLPNRVQHRRIISLTATPATSASWFTSPGGLHEPWYPTCTLLRRSNLPPYSIRTQSLPYAGAEVLQRRLQDHHLPRAPRCADASAPITPTRLPLPGRPPLQGHRTGRSSSLEPCPSLQSLVDRVTPLADQQHAGSAISLLEPRSGCTSPNGSAPSPYAAATRIDSAHPCRPPGDVVEHAPPLATYLMATPPAPK